MDTWQQGRSKVISTDRVRDDLWRPSCLAKKQNHSIKLDSSFHIILLFFFFFFPELLKKLKGIGVYCRLLLLKIHGYCSLTINLDESRVLILFFI